MTTGRINQVANPSSTRGESSPTRRPESWVRGRQVTDAGRGFPAELQRSAAARRRGAGPGFPDRRGAGSPRRGSDVVGRLGAQGFSRSLSAGSVAVAVVLGREVPSHTPLAHVLASLLGPTG